MFDNLELKKEVLYLNLNKFENKYGFPYFMMSNSLNYQPCQKYDNRSDLPNFLDILNNEIRCKEDWWILKKKKEEFRRKRAVKIIQKAWRNSKFAYRPDTIVGLNRLRHSMIEDGLNNSDINSEIDDKISKIVSKWK